MSMEDFEKYLRGRGQSIQHLTLVEPFDKYMKSQQQKSGIEESSKNELRNVQDCLGFLQLSPIPQIYPEVIPSI